MGNEASSASTTNGTICGGNAASLEDTTMLDYGLEEAAAHGGGEADTPVDSDHYATPYLKKYPYSAGATMGFHDAPPMVDNNLGPDDCDSDSQIAGEEDHHPRYERRKAASNNRGDRRRPRKLSMSQDDTDIDPHRHEARPEKGMGRRKRSMSADLTSYGHERSGRLDHDDSDWDDFRIGDDDDDGRLPVMPPANGNQAMNPADLAAMWRSRNAQSERRPGPLYFWGRPPLQRRMSEPIVSYTPSPSPPPPGDTPMAVEEVYDAQPEAREVFKRCDRVMMFDDSGLL